MCVRRPNLLGQKFNHWTVLEFVRVDEHGKALWLCECDCEKKTHKEVATTYLIHGLSKSCGCLQKELVKNLGLSQYKGTNDICGRYFSAIKSNAKRRKLKFDITKEYIQTLLEQQNYKCALSGLEIHGSRNESRKDHSTYIEQTASLDRIDSSKGYIEGNVQWVHKDINDMKMDRLDKYFIELCHKVSDYQRNKEIETNQAILSNTYQI